MSDIKSVVRGPKPLAALRELGITPTLTVPEPNTWRELLTTLDEQLPVANLVVGLQEYGVTNRSLIAGLEARGATVDAVHVYDWALPEDCGPLEENIRRIAAGEVDVAMFTSGNQVLNLLKLADDLGLPTNCAERFAVSSSPRSAQPLARCCAARICLSTWSRRIPRWATWCRKPRNARASCSRESAALRVSFPISDCGTQGVPGIADYPRQSAIRNPK